MKTEILNELQQIEKANGLLRAEDVVAFAANPKTALHSCFQWDDTAAACEYRLWQARQVIRVSVTILDSERGPVRAFVSLGEDRARAGGGYRNMDSVMTNAALREALVAEALSELERVRRKYSELTELAEVYAAMDRAKARKSRPRRQPKRELATA